MITLDVDVFAVESVIRQVVDVHVGYAVDLGRPLNWLGLQN